MRDSRAGPAVSAQLAVHALLTRNKVIQHSSVYAIMKKQCSCIITSITEQ